MKKPHDKKPGEKLLQENPHLPKDARDKMSEAQKKDDKK